MPLSLTKKVSDVPSRTSIWIDGFSQYWSHEGVGPTSGQEKRGADSCKTDVYFTNLHTAGNAIAAAINLITSPIKNGSKPN
jgi:hypothetical protein